MPNEIVKSDEGYKVGLEEKSIFFSNAELAIAGCANCIWKIHNQCPHKLKEDSVKEEGICNEMMFFLTSLAGKGEDNSLIWEKFHIYKARIQETLDYKDYEDLKKKIQEKEKHAYAQGGSLSEEDKDKLAQLRMDRTAAKIWWSKLNAHVIQSLQKVGDREVKKKTEGNVPGIMNAKTINFINTDKKQVEEKK